MIQVLDQKVIDQIAAGEVVERPSHLVKELVENALDAGAGQIIIELFDGGRKIILSDNGMGMSKEDLPLALQRFATSKISNIDDIWKLNSFGFRGEALASIASVSELKLTSRKKGASEAFSVSSLFGHVFPVEEASLVSGTQIIVDKLFENVPARLKFLKTDSAELGQIKMMLKALALAHPQIEFQIKENGKLIHFWQPQPNLLDRVKIVLEEKKVFSHSVDKNGFKIEFVYSDPSAVFRTSRNIWIFVQNRYVQDRAIQAALMESYRSLLMHGEYPLVVLKLHVPSEFVDVNVHPTKSQVKFQDSSIVYRLVHSTLRQTLETAPWSLHQAQKIETHSGSSSTREFYSAPNPPSSSEKADSSGMSMSAYQGGFRDRAFETTQYRKKEINLSTLGFLAQSREEFVPTLRESPAGMPASDSLSGAQAVEPSSDVLNAERNKSSNSGFWGQLEVIGQLHLTYIVAQSGDQLFLVDQHAAHERVRFETLMEMWKGGQDKLEIQEFLFPQVLDLSAEQVQALENFLPEFEKFGLRFEMMGPTSIGITAAPSMLEKVSFQSLFDEISSQIVDRGGSFRFDEKVVDLCATWACHSVVRAGQALSVAEMRALLSEMDQFPLSEYCPHGRPVYVKMAQAEIERLFGRRG